MTQEQTVTEKKTRKHRVSEKMQLRQTHEKDGKSVTNPLLQQADAGPFEPSDLGKFIADVDDATAAKKYIREKNLEGRFLVVSVRAVLQPKVTTKPVVKF